MLFKSEQIKFMELSDALDAQAQQQATFDSAMNNSSFEDEGYSA